MSREVDRRFALFGSHVRLLIGAAVDPRTPAPEATALGLESAMRLMHTRLTRFQTDSELSMLNRDPREVVPASDTMLAFVAAALIAARGSGGLVDPTVIDDLEAAGYRSSLRDRRPAPLALALAKAPARAPARPDPADRWRSLAIDRVARTVTRDPGVRLDSGGIAKGLAADLLAARLAGYESFAIDCGGDMRIGGARRVVEVKHPMTSTIAHRIELGDGGVATSGLDRRIWRSLGGEYLHHIIDPGRRRPAWTGIIQATAVSPTALEAEWRAKAALLSGPYRGRRILERHGGVLVHDDGTVDVVAATAEIGIAAAA
jgi:thiamine biosynthesis lipoprotein